MAQTARRLKFKRARATHGNEMSFGGRIGCERSLPYSKVGAGIIDGLFMDRSVCHL